MTSKGWSASERSQSRCTRNGLFEAKMQDLIGDIKLDERLRQHGEDDMKERERRG